MEAVKVLAKLKSKSQSKALVSKLAKRQDNPLVNLFGVSADMRKVLEPPRAGRQLITVRYSSFDKRSYQAGVRLARACELMGFTYTGPVGLPQKIKRWTVLKSPFKYKKHQESFEQRYNRSVVTIDTGERSNLIPNLIQFIYKTNYVAVDVKLKIRRFISPEQVYTDPYTKEKLSTAPIDPSLNYSNFDLSHHNDIINEIVSSSEESSAPSSSSTPSQSTPSPPKAKKSSKKSNQKTPIPESPSTSHSDQPSPL